MKPKTLSPQRRGGAEPTDSEVIAELRHYQDSLCYSFAEADGIIRDRGALHSIACVRSAIRSLSAARRLAGSKKGER